MKQCMSDKKGTTELINLMGLLLLVRILVIMCLTDYIFLWCFYPKDFITIWTGNVLLTNANIVIQHVANLSSDGIYSMLQSYAFLWLQIVMGKLFLFSDQ